MANGESQIHHEVQVHQPNEYVVTDRNKKCGCISLFIGLLILSVTLFLGVIRQDILVTRVRNRLDKMSIMHTESEQFPIFEDSSRGIEQSVSYYFWNITNPQEILKVGEPKLEEIGPFVYNFVTKRANIKFHLNGTVSFNEIKVFTFDRESSVADEATTQIVTIDVPKVTLFSIVDDKDPRVKMAYSSRLGCKGDKSHPFVRLTVKQATFEGIPHKAVAALKAKERGSSDPAAAVPTSDTTFSFAKEKNGTLGKLIHIFTGETGVQDLNRVSLVEYMSEPQYWHNNEYRCNRIEGILGTQRPSLDNSTIKKIYFPDLCRSLLLEFQKETHFDGIALRRFKISRSVLAPSRDSPENECYDLKKFFGKGVLDIQPCVPSGAPLAVSLPHFHRADKALYLDRVDGMAPSLDRHEFVMDHEPFSGVTVRARLRLQFNAVIKGDSWCGLDAWLDADVIQVFPLYWTDTAITLRSAVRDKLREASNLPHLAKRVFNISMLVGGVFILLAIICFVTDSSPTF